MSSVVTEPRGSFLTHANWLRAIAAEAGLTNLRTMGDAHSELSLRLREFPKEAASTQAIDYQQVRRSLSHAWGTEFLLSLPASFAFDEDVIKLSNNWAAVQTYYVVYHAIQALLVAKSFPRPPNHAKTQNQYSSLWIGRTTDFSPWTFGLGAAGFVNTPLDQVIDHGVHPWTSCVTSNQLSLVASAYKSTREERLKEAFGLARRLKQSHLRKEWREEEAKRLEGGRRARKEPTFSLPRLSSIEKQSEPHWV